MPRILIVEDEVILLATLETALTQAGYDVYSATDGEEGLKKIKALKPDLILLDVLLPKMNGFEILKELKIDGGLSNIPVIIASNSGQPVEIEEAKRLGAVDFIVKIDFDPEQVVEKIKKYVSPSKE